MSELQIFSNPEFGKIRTIQQGEKTLFCASDIARSLGYSNPNKAVNDHCRAITKCSTRPRVSVCGTGAAWVELSGFSREYGYPRYQIPPKRIPYCQVRLRWWICLPSSLPTLFNGDFRRPAVVSLLRLHKYQLC